MTEPVIQLPLDGIPAPVVTDHNHSSGVGARRPFSPAQLAIMQHIDKHGSIRTVEAGVIIHRERDGKTRFARHVANNNTISVLANGTWRHRTRNGIGCCRFASTDGLEAMKRLAKRGIVQRAGRGVWIRTGDRRPA